MAWNALELDWPRLLDGDLFMLCNVVIDVGGRGSTCWSAWTTASALGNVSKGSQLGMAPYPLVRALHSAPGGRTEFWE